MPSIISNSTVIKRQQLKAHFKKHELIFKSPAGTSRGIMTIKTLWLLTIQQDDFKGIGECSIIEGLSFDNTDLIEKTLTALCNDIENYPIWLSEKLIDFPAIRFALEMALLNLHHQKEYLYFPSNFTNEEDSIKINGLIWMGSKENMLAQIQQKVAAGFSCLKLKIGAINFEDEIDLLQYIRKQFSSEKLTIRVDANGAFKASEALEKLKKLTEFDIHSIEQPIATNQWQAMALLCEKSPIAIALDEELIGVHEYEKQKLLLETIQPNYIILKPSLLGGFAATQQWIDVAQQLNIDWWMTSALESNIGLNAIAQFAYTFNNSLPQGLGTGGLYENNFESPVYLKGEQLFCKKIL